MSRGTICQRKCRRHLLYMDERRSDREQKDICEENLQFFYFQVYLYNKRKKKNIRGLDFLFFATKTSKSRCLFLSRYICRPCEYRIRRLAQSCNPLSDPQCNFHPSSLKNKNENKIKWPHEFPNSTKFPKRKNLQLPGRDLDTIAHAP